MWIFIWIVLSLFILSVFGWSVIILRQQKQSWAAFAAKHALDFQPRRFMEAGIVRGTLEGFGVTLYSDAQKTDDVRGERYVSVIEVEMGSGMPTGAAIGTPEMRNFINTLTFPDIVEFNHPKWTAAHVAKTRDVQALKAFMTPARLDMLMDIFSMNRVSALLFFDEQGCVFHLETIDPLRNPEKLDRIMKRLLASLKELAPPGSVAARSEHVHSESGQPEDAIEQ